MKRWAQIDDLAVGILSADARQEGPRNREFAGCARPEASLVVKIDNATVPAPDGENVGRVVDAAETVALAEPDDAKLVRAEVNEGAAHEQCLRGGVAAGAGGGARRRRRARQRRDD